jgi:hypothetical protein
LGQQNPGTSSELSSASVQKPRKSPVQGAEPG